MRLDHISGSLPYPQHADEAAIAEPAAEILKTGDFHPGTFNYPSLPKYLAAAAMAVGFVSEAPNLKIRKFGDINVTDRLGNVSHPYYTLPAVVEKARWLFALLSVLALALSGVAAWQLLGHPVLLTIGPLALSYSNYFFKMSWRYLNVDIVGSFS